MNTSVNILNKCPRILIDCSSSSKPITTCCTRQNISSCSVLSPEIVMQDAYIGGRSENNIKCVLHEDLGWKNRTTRYILPRHWFYEWFSQFHSCGTYSVLSRSHSNALINQLLNSSIRNPHNNKLCTWRHSMPPPLQVDNIFAIIRQVAVLFRHVGYWRHQQQVDLWPFDLESGVRVTCDASYLCANFNLPRPLCSRLRPDVRDRQTDVRQKHGLMPPPYGGGIITLVYLPIYRTTPQGRPGNRMPSHGGFFCRTRWWEAATVTTGALRRAKLQSNYPQRHTDTWVFFTGWLPFLSPNQQC